MQFIQGTDLISQSYQVINANFLVLMVIAVVNLTVLLVILKGK